MMGDVVDLNAHRTAKNPSAARIADLESDIAEIESWEPLVPGTPSFRVDRLRDLATEARASAAAAHERAARTRSIVSDFAAPQDPTPRPLKMLADALRREAAQIRREIALRDAARSRQRLLSQTGDRA